MNSECLGSKSQVQELLKMRNFALTWKSQRECAKYYSEIVVKEISRIEAY